MKSLNQHISIITNRQVLLPSRLFMISDECSWLSRMTLSSRQLQEILRTAATCPWRRSAGGGEDEGHTIVRK